MAAVVAALSFSTSADARMWHNRGFHGGWHHGWNGGWRHGWRGGWHRGWRGGWHHGWRGGYWGPYWGGVWGPTVVIGPGYSDGYCFVKKVRHYDRDGNAYIRRVRVCR